MQNTVEGVPLGQLKIQAVDTELKSGYVQAVLANAYRYRRYR